MTAIAMDSTVINIQEITDEEVGGKAKGLATDVGSAVSHGAVIAREYGLSAIVNLRAATKVFKTGDRVRLDADTGVLVRIDSAS